MKVALVRAKYNAFGGAERIVNSVAESLLKLGATPTIITRAWPANAGARIGHRIVNPRYFTSTGRDRGFAKAVAQLTFIEKFDLVQSYERIPDCDIFHAVEGVHASWLHARQKVQTPWQRFGVRINPHHRDVLNAEARMLTSPRLRAVICVSDMVRRDIMARFQVPESKLHVIYGAIDCDYFHPSHREKHRDSLRQTLNIPAHAPTGIFVGSGFERKGVASFLRVIARLKACYGIVVGHDKHLKRYQALARELGLERRITFTGGTGDVRPYLAVADFFLMPTLYEPFGLTYAEAMACELPVIVSSQAGAADWITHGVNGYVVDPLDEDAMVRTVDAAVAAPTLGHAARQTVLPYSTDRITADYANFYRQLMA